MKTELQQAARDIRAWQLSKDLSDVQMLKKFPGLGSTKTYTRLLAADVEDLDTERWLIELRQVQALIEALADASTDDEPLYDDLSTCARLRVSALEAMKERGNNRLIITLGPPGSGKTSAAIALAGKYGSRIVLAEADETWKSANNALGGLLRAVGVKDLPASAADRLARLIERLREGERCLIIDEAHHMGVPAFNLVKTLLNQTGCQVILLALPVLFRRLEMAAWEEVRQLTQNRLLERIRLDQVQPHDAEKFLARRLAWSNGEIKKAVAAIKEPMARHGQFAFLKLACRRARRDAGGDPVTLDGFLAAAKQIMETR
jgi:DNA transposition AAA+ family ATPase